MAVWHDRIRSDLCGPFRYYVAGAEVTLSGTGCKKEFEKNESGRQDHEKKSLH